MNIEIWHATGQLAEYTADAVPRVGDTFSFAGSRHECRTVIRVDWGVYVTADPSLAAQLETVRVMVE